MALTQTGTEAEVMKEYWKEEILSELRSNLVFYNLGMISNHPKNTGTRVHWLSVADLSASSALSEGYDPTSYALSAGDITADVTQYGASIKVSDLLEGTAISTYMATLKDRVARNAQLTVDQVGIRDAILTGGGVVQYAGTAVARNSVADNSTFDMDLGEVKAAARELKRNNVMPMAGNNFVAVIHPDATYDVMADSEWITAAQNNDPGFQNLAVPGKIGSLYGVDFVESSECLAMTNSGSANTDVYQTYVFGKEAFGVSEFMMNDIIIKSPHPSSDLELYSTIGWKSAFAAAELKPSAMVRIEHAVSRETRS